jgi:glyoxylase-like metal-dependent hydrolase (beta-lactamase superfamily II)/rhodanese-related sulfurtransferase
VDPVLERAETYLKMLEQEKWHLSYVIDTHTHADHLSAGPALCDHLCAAYLMHKSARPQCPTHRVESGEKIRIGELSIVCEHTPGHTEDSLTLVLHDRLLTGDFLFIGESGAGRLDLPTGDPGEHFDSLQKLKKYPDYLMVFPAHDYHGGTYSTLCQERQTNPRLKFTSRDEYIRSLSSMALPPPEWMIQVVQANYGCTRNPKAVQIPEDLPACEVKGALTLPANAQPVRVVTPEQVKQLIDSGNTVLVLDVRNPDEYVSPLGHIRGSRIIPLLELAARIGEIEGYRESEIITVCKVGGRSLAAAGMLMQAGFAKSAAMSGGMVEWIKCGYPTCRDGD